MSSAFHVPASIKNVIPPRATALLEKLASPVVEYTLGGSGVSAKQSYAGGYPFMRPGDDWPWSPVFDLPMVFLLQINFAEVPSLASFPKEGMLQMFVDGGDDTGMMGKEDAEDGKDGLFLRWITADELEQGSKSMPANPLPYHPTEYKNGVNVSDNLLPSPLVELCPRELLFNSTTKLPAYTELYESANLSEEEKELAGLLRPYFFGDEIDIYEAYENISMPYSSIGGRPNFMQIDCRRLQPDLDPRLILQIASDGKTFDWGGGGNAQLFGAAEALAAGDLSSCWWDWSAP